MNRTRRLFVLVSRFQFRELRTSTGNIPQVQAPLTVLSDAVRHYPCRRAIRRESFVAAFLAPLEARVQNRSLPRQRKRPAKLHRSYLQTPVGTVSHWFCAHTRLRRGLTDILSQHGSALRSQASGGA